MKLPMQEFVHSPYPNVTIISFKRSQHVYLMILMNSIILNTFFLATFIKIKHPSPTPSVNIKSIGS